MSYVFTRENIRWCVVTFNHGLQSIGYVQTNTPSHVRYMVGCVKVVLAHQQMMCRWMVFSEVVSTVFFATSPEKSKLALCNPIFDPVVARVACFRSFMQTWAVCMSWAVELSVSMGVPWEGWRCPNSTKVLSTGTASWAPKNMPAVSASEAEAGTPHIILTSTWTGPFDLMVGGHLEMSVRV